MLFFTGSGGYPHVLPGAAFVQHALSLGFHFFAVSYANSPSVGGFCAARNYEPQCYLRIRTIRLDGGMYSDNATCAEKNGCVLPALGAMTQFEAVLRATAGKRPTWKPFVLARSKIAWRSIVAAGHSQGAGMALMLGIRLNLASVVQLSGVDDTIPSLVAPSGLVPAPWLVHKNKFATPPSRIWGLGNVNGFCCKHWHATWPAAKVTGPLVSVDGAAPPYGGSHQLCSRLNLTATWRPGGQGQHGAPYEYAGYADVWTLMLTNKPQTGTTGANTSQASHTAAEDCACSVVPGADVGAANVLPIESV